MDRKKVGFFLQSSLIIILAMFNSLTYADSLILVDEFHEHYSQEVPVSGNVIAGVEFSAATKQKNDFSPHIHKSETLPASALVCIQILSKDGTYNAKNTYQIPEAAGTTNLPIDHSRSQHIKVLEQLTADEALAVKASLGPCFGNEENVYLPIHPTSSEGQKDILHIFIDSLGATGVKLAARTANRKIVRADCQPLEGKRLTGFDYVCSFPATELGQSTLEVQVIRTKHKRKLDSILFKILL